MEDTNQKRYQRSSDYIHRVIAGQHVLVSIGAGVANFNGYIQLNDSAVLIWEELARPCTVEELCEKVCSEFDVSREQAESDIRELLNAGIRNQMVAERE